ncbi:MAG: ScyD/ScyE family protein [Gemmatimonadota bacterium]
MLRKGNHWPALGTVAALALALGGCDSSATAPPPSDAADSFTVPGNETDGIRNLAAAPELLVTGLEGASGSTIGPGRTLYVTEGAAGRVSRVDRETGAVTTFASGLPPSIIGVGGAVDVTFLGETAYVLVTLVDDALFPTGQINGIYRVDGPNDFTIIADLGAYNLAHPPGGFDFFVETGVLYAMESYRGGFLVTDGHLNRVLHVTLDGQITTFRAFGNNVPTGLDVHGKTVYMAEAGPVPHLPEDGKIVTLDPNSMTATPIASGAPLLVDVEFGRGRTLFALSQGTFGGGEPGAPALPNTGALLKVNGDGSLTVLADDVNLPTSVEIVDDTAYVVSLAGEIWRIDDVSAPPHGRKQ